MARTKQLPVITKLGGKPKSARKKSEVSKKPMTKGIGKQISKVTKSKGDGEEKKKRRSEVDAEKNERKQRKFKASTIANRECKRYSTGKDGTKLLLQKKPFSNLVRETLQQYDDSIRIKKSSLLAIQEGMESWLTEGMTRTLPLCRLAGKMAPTAKILRMAIEPIFYGERS